MCPVPSVVPSEWDTGVTWGNKIAWWNGTDICGQFFQAAMQDFNPDCPEPKDVLEIGCAEFNWLGLAHATWPDMRLTGIDHRGWKLEMQRDYCRIVRGDVLTHDFQASSFDWVVSVSTIEHIGLGAYGDPIHVDGDTMAMERAWEWVKPGGMMYLDVPYEVGDGYQVVKRKHRIYDDATITSRLLTKPWVERWRGHARMQAPISLGKPTVPSGSQQRPYFVGLCLQKP